MLIGLTHSENWNEVKTLLMDALALDPPERHTFLQSQPVSREIKSEVESLLALEHDADNILRSSAIELSRDFFDDAPEPGYSSVGQEIGAYRVVSELGIGGMGVVYLAERTDGKFEQKVAIKLLKREFNSGKIRESFKREIDIQSKLIHPNVATMLDTGTTDDGIPYIVMEYVEGLAIDKYCRENKLGLTARLKIFNKACDAVAFAHQNLIVHRDLKPSNIIVTSDGNPKLLDFGISKLLGNSGVESSNTTLMVAMTPEYASPEQIKGESVSTATDVYSLGVILFKLLTGGYPYNTKNKSNSNLLKEITDSEPFTPSFAISQSSEPPSPVNSPQLKGDLDNIILKSLRKEPDERYRTVEQFAADIWRYIDDLPVAARPATHSYRLSKFYKRNRIAVIASMLIFVSLVAGLTTALWQANAARAQAAFADEARNTALAATENAKSEQAKSEKISKFMAKVFSYANPAWFGEGARFGGNARVIDVMDDLGGKIDVEFAADADVAAELHHKFTEIYNIVRQFEKDVDRAEKYLQTQKFHAFRALELRRQFYGESHELVAKDMMFISFFAGDDSEQARMLAQAIQMMRETNPRNLNLPYMLEGYANQLITTEPVDLTDIYLQEALPPPTDGKYELAEKYFVEMLDLFTAHYGEGEYAPIIGNCDVARIKTKLRKFDEAQPYYQQCKAAETKFQNKDQAKAIRSLLDRIENTSRDITRLGDQ